MSNDIHIFEATASYTEFLRQNLEGNIPCLISPDLISKWSAWTLWREPGPSCRPNWKYIRAQYGDEVVSVAHCGSRMFSDQEREERPLHEVIDLWESGAGENLYIKDWHLARSVRQRGHAPFYEVPDIFRDDWMNSFWEQEGRDDFRFVYMGIAGTFTPLHRDVYTSYSWSTNITGTKLWRLFPPSVSRLLRRYPERSSSEIVYDVRDVDRNVFHGFEDAAREMILVEQHPGWTIFIPSGWYHQVENVTDAISINHNWCNISNLPSMFTSLLAAVADVESELMDVHELLRARSNDPEWERKWVSIVQDVLLKDSGWDWLTFWRMIVHNVGQQKDPPLIQDSVWPVTPPTLHPPFSQTRNVVYRLMDDFLKVRALELKHVAGLSDVLDNLRHIISAS